MTDSIIKLIVTKDASVQSGIKDLKEIQKLVNDINKKGIQLSKAKGTETAKLTSQITTQTKELQKQIRIKKKNSDLTDEELRDKLRIQEIDRARTREMRKQAKQQAGLVKNTNTWSKALGSLMFKFNALGNLIGNFVGQAINRVMMAMRETVGQAIEFEKTFTNILTLLSDADKAKFGKLLEKGSIELQKKYGLAIEDTNKALFDAISAGIPAGEAIKFLDEAAKLAIGGVTDLKVAVDGVTSVLNAYGLEASETEKITSAFFTAQKFGKTTVAELSANIGKIAPIAKQAGVGFDTLLASMAQLTLGGLSTEEASTALKGAFAALLKPADGARKLLEKYNVPIGASELKTVGFSEALKRLAIAAKENPDVLAEMIPNIRALTAVGALGEEQIKNLDNIVKEINVDFGEGSSLTKAYAEQQKTLSQIINRLKVSFRSFFVEGILKFTDFVQRNIKTIKVWGKVLVTIISALAGYKLGLMLATLWTNKLKNANLKSIFSFKALKIAIKGVNAAIKANPLGLFIGLLTAAASALFLFKDAEEESNDELERGNELLDERVKLLFDLENIFIKRGIDLRNLINDYEAVLKIVKKEIGFDKTRLEILKDYIETRKLVLKQQLLEAKSELIKIGDEIVTLRGIKIATQADVDRSRRNLSIYENEIDKNNELLAFVDKRLKSLTTEKKAIENNTEATRKAIATNIQYMDSIDKRIEKLKELLDAYKKLIDFKEPEIEPFKLRKQLEGLPEAEISFWDDLRGEAQKYWRENKENAKFFTEALISEWEKELKAKEKLLADETEAQEKALDRQEQRAMMGQENTLAFEKEMLAKKEAERVKQEKKAERQAKLKAWYNIVANSENMSEAFKKLAMMEVAAAMFKEGGIVEDNLPKNGIFKGKSHKHGGIPIVVEGKEGIFSGNEMANLGKDNFYNLKNILGDGKIDSNLFEKQNALIPFAKVINPDGSSKIIAELKNLKQEIKSKKEYNINWDNEGNRIEEIKENNRTIINKYINSRPRI